MKNPISTPRCWLNAKLIKMPDRIIVGSTTAEYADRAKSGDLEAIIQTYDDMLGKSIKRIVEWTLKTGAEADAKARAANAPRS